MRNQQYYIGIDWGLEKCGLAIADSENRIATPFREIDTARLEEEMADFIKDNPVEKIIVGANDNGLEKKEIKKMEENGWPIVFEDEDYSTLMAQRNIEEFRDKGITKRDNAEAAKIILQSWLDKNFNK